MTYITRKGILFNPFIALVTTITVTIFAIMSDWNIQYNAFTLQQDHLPLFTTYQITMISTYAIMGLLISWIWYNIGKILSPRSAKGLAKVFSGFKSEIFIEKDINSYNMNVWRFVFVFLNVGLALFAVDLFLSNTLFESPNLLSMLLSILIVTILEPIQLINNDIGIRAYNETKSEIVAISSVLDRIAFRLLQMGGLIGSLASITLNTHILNSIPGKIRILFIRSFMISIFILFFYHLLFQPEAILKDWKSRNIRSGKTKVGVR